MHAEIYGYAGAGLRAVKRSGAASARYLPGMEWRRSRRAAWLTVVAQGCRCLRRAAGAPSALSPRSMWRYELSDRQGSVGVELDGEAALLTREAFYPNGGTAVWRVRHRSEADCKTVRHAGQERDDTGLIYYGFRYYAPWLSRWISPDPAGDVDGPNRFAMVRNNLATRRDQLGLWSSPDDWGWVGIALIWAAVLIAAVRWAAQHFAGRPPALRAPPVEDIASLATLIRTQSSAAHAGHTAQALQAREQVSQFIRERWAVYIERGMGGVREYDADRSDWTLVVHGSSSVMRWRFRSPPIARSMLEQARDRGASSFELAATAMLLPHTALLRFGDSRRASGRASAMAGGDVLFAPGMADTSGDMNDVPSRPSSRAGRSSSSGSSRPSSAARGAMPPSIGTAGEARGGYHGGEIQFEFSRTYLRQSAGFSDAQHAIMGRVLGNLSDAAWLRRRTHAVGELRSADLANWDGTGGGRGAWRLLFSLHGNTVQLNRIENYHEGKRKLY